VDEAITQSPSRVDASNHDEEMNDNTEHKKPKSSGMTPKAKKTKNKHGSNATVLQSRNLEDEFEELQKFHQTTDSEGAVGGES
jgi:type VI protein secretion system component VasK